MDGQKPHRLRTMRFFFARWIASVGSESSSFAGKHGTDRDYVEFGRNLPPDAIYESALGEAAEKR